MTPDPVVPGLILLLVLAASVLLVLLIGQKKRVKQQETRLAELTQALQLSEAEHQEFVYIISHDLMEPVRAIDMFTALVQKRHPETIDEEAAEFFSYIHQSSGELSRMIQGVLEYSRVGTEDYSPDSVLLETAVNDALAKLREETCWQPAANIEYGSLPVVTADRRRLVQLLQHLLRNALLYSRGDDQVEIVITGAARENDWLLSITDKGPGIDPDYLHRVFRPFARLDRNNGDGTGMGLAICRRIVAQHGGEIWAESAPGAGTSVFFSLPNTGNETTGTQQD